MTEPLYTDEQAQSLAQKLLNESGLHVNIDSVTGQAQVRDGALGGFREATPEERVIISGTMNTPGATPPSTSAAEK